MSRLMSVALCAIICCGSLLAEAGAREAVLKMLEKSNLEQGYDSVRKSYVAVVEEQRRMQDPAHSKLFLKTRAQMAKGLVLDGKCEILKFFSQRIKAEDSVTTRQSGETASNAASSRTLISAKARLKGCRVLCSSEDWDADSGVYTMAMAVVWSEKLERTNPAVGEISEADWNSWLAKLDLTCVVGGRQFTDAAGRRGYCGIGCSDVEGLKGIRYSKAVGDAENAARMNLIFELYSDAATVELLEQNASELERVDKSEERMSVDFKSKIDAKCQKNGVRTKKIHSTVVKHPVSGRSMCVAVVTVLE